MIYKRLFVCLVLLLAAAVVRAQEDRPMRVEIEAKAGSDAYHVVPFGRNGLVLFYAAEANGRDNTRTWYFSMYDVNFREKWTKEIRVDRYMKLSFFDTDNDCLYLFLEKSYNSVKENEFTILSADVNTGVISAVTAYNTDNSDITLFRVMDGRAYLAGRMIPGKGATCAQTALTFTLLPLITGLTVIRYQPSFLIIDLASGKVTSSNFSLRGQAWAESMYTDTLNNVVHLAVRQYQRGGHNSLHLYSYRSDGSMIHSSAITSPDDKRKLSSARMAVSGNDRRLILGTYNNDVKGNRANPAHNGFVEGASGIYIAATENEQTDFVRFYNFSDLKNFFSYLSDKKALKMKNRAVRRQAKGKEISFDYSLLLHDVIIRNDQYIAIAEVYYPEYHTVSYTTYDAYGRPYTTTYTQFDGYRYTNAIIACFNSRGDLLWDNSFEIWNILDFRLRERVSVMFDAEDIILTYSSEGGIASKIIRGNEVVEGKEITEIKTNYRDDKLISDFNSDLDYWYGNYFITYGYQKIKNNTSDHKSRRTVFYFNKIAFN